MKGLPAAIATRLGVVQHGQQTEPFPGKKDGGVQGNAARAAEMGVGTAAQARVSRKRCRSTSRLLESVSGASVLYQF